MMRMNEKIMSMARTLIESVNTSGKLTKYANRTSEDILLAENEKCRLFVTLIEIKNTLEKSEKPYYTIHEKAVDKTNAQSVFTNVLNGEEGDLSETSVAYLILKVMRLQSPFFEFKEYKEYQTSEKADSLINNLVKVAHRLVDNLDFENEEDILAATDTVATDDEEITIDITVDALKDIRSGKINLCWLTFSIVNSASDDDIPVDAINSDYLIKKTPEEIEKEIFDAVHYLVVSNEVYLGLADDCD